MGCEQESYCGDTDIQVLIVGNGDPDLRSTARPSLSFYVDTVFFEEAISVIVPAAESHIIEPSTGVRILTLLAIDYVPV